MKENEERVRKQILKEGKEGQGSSNELRGNEGRIRRQQLKEGKEGRVSRQQ